MPARDSDTMWCLVMFDLPVQTKTQRSEATHFRNLLLDLGFCMSQFSVYVQYLPFSARLTHLVKEIKNHLPQGGEVRIVGITDTQWSKAIRFSNKTEKLPEKNPSQLLLF